MFRAADNKAFCGSCESILTWSNRKVQRRIDSVWVYWTCMTSLALSPTNLSTVPFRSLNNPPSASIMILHCCAWYPGHRCLNSHLSGLFFRVSSSLFFSLFPIDGQLISTVMTCLVLWLIIIFIIIINQISSITLLLYMIITLDRTHTIYVIFVPAGFMMSRGY